MLTDDPTIRRVNRRVFSADVPTDVISIAYPPLPGDPGQYSADVVVNVQRAVDYVAGQSAIRRDRMRKRRWTADSELALYIAHGIDHLTGADDAAYADRRRMRGRELRWLRKASEAGLLQGLIKRT